MKRARKGKDRRRKGRAKVFLYALIAVIGLGVGYYLSPSIQGLQEENIDPARLRGGETKPVLSPAYFIGQTARAYRVAKEIPQVLDSLYCYCQCERNIGHKSLLSCYTDQHAAYCDICQNEALRAYELYKDGKDTVTIRKAIDREFGV